MKIGVALSGCDVGGICAWTALSELESRGLEIGMISASCVPAVAALLYANGCDRQTMLKLSDTFLSDAKELDIDFAIANFSVAFKQNKSMKIPLAINSVNVPDGNIIAFTDNYFIETENIKTHGMCDSYDMLSATVSFTEGLGSYRYGGGRLCDFSCWYGCPIHQLKLAGFTKVISLSYLPKLPQTPYEVMVKQMISSNSSAADVHITTEFDKNCSGFEEYSEIAVKMLDNSIDKIIMTTLF